MTIIALGGINEDVVLSVTDLPQRGQTIHAAGVTRGVGGKGLNLAIAAARQGGAVRLLGAVGDDAAGAWLRGVMAREAIDTSGVALLGDHPTGQAMITLAANGDNTIIVNAGANDAYDAAAIDAAAADGETFVTQFEARLDAIERLFSSPAAQRGTRILNAAPASDAARPLLRLADILILNETELQFFADLPSVPEDRATLVSAARGLVSRADQQIVVTLGAKGALWVTAADDTLIESLKVDAIDTIGAGDCFCGVLAAAIDDGADMTTALHRANTAAALSVTRRGAGESAPTRAEVDAMLGAA